MTNDGCVIDGCLKKILAKSMCSLHYQRFRVSGDPLATPGRNVWSLDYLLSRCQTAENGCLEYQMRRQKDGYGIFSFKGRQYYANRAALEMHLGRALLPGMLACHRCDNPPCCNPDHLYEGTPKQNSQDMVERNRFKNMGKKGSESVRAKLSEADVIDARARYARGERIIDINRIYPQVGKQTLRSAIIGKTWKHVN